jgi:chemotaxis family two-component system sensor kinase Cph1
LLVRVLVVEDEPLIGMVIEDVILELGWEIVGPASTLKEALTLVSCAVIDYAILDVNVSDGQSYTVAELLADRGVPLLLATGYDCSTFPERFRKEGCLNKPYSAEQLEKQLRLLSDRALSHRN